LLPGPLIFRGLQYDAEMFLVAMIAGVAVTAAAGAVCGAAYFHVLVPLNDALRSKSAPSYTGRREAVALAHSCVAGHEPPSCVCPRRYRRTLLEYKGADWRRRYEVPGTYPLGQQVPVRVGYSSNRPSCLPQGWMNSASSNRGDPGACREPSIPSLDGRYVCQPLLPDAWNLGMSVVPARL
jgi:hypothetical protein